jgi:hypothetical protein
MQFTLTPRPCVDAQAGPVRTAHELGHFIAVKRPGLSADLPMFLPGFGAYRASDKTLAPDMAPSYGVTAYFVILLAALGYLASLAPLGALNEQKRASEQ